MSGQVFVSWLKIRDVYNELLRTRGSEVLLTTDKKCKLSYLFYFYTSLNFTTSSRHQTERLSVMNGCKQPSESMTRHSVLLTLSRSSDNDKSTEYWGNDSWKPKKQRFLRNKFPADKSFKTISSCNRILISKYLSMRSWFFLDWA